ncbi:16S rRNA (cytidine(1402)-2'-O)-methyltransferase [archaeon]|nr:MAG: 16S rRNA (cytidine(1402)-2'-O)-methyltransferase [archaeon]
MKLLIIMLMFTWTSAWYINPCKLSIRKVRSVSYWRSFSGTASTTEPDQVQWVQPGHVYFVATPIGNKYDISQRAIRILSDVDIVVAEDTRQTIELLRRLNLPHKKIMSHHEYNQPSSIPHIINLAKSMQSIAVVTDAGTPGISDPGAALAAALSAAEAPLHPIPGPSSVITALSISGFYASEFTFLGFLAVKGKERREKIEKIKSCLHTIVFFEAPHRIVKTLTDLIASNENIKFRPCVCCRELTKKHEEIKRGSVQEILDWLKTVNTAQEVSSQFAPIFI